MIFSVTLSDSREAEIADALRSVAPHVDRVLLVDTGITDRTIRYARKAAGEKLLVAEHEWVDFSTARNAALYEARRAGAQWIVIVDSDERLDFGSVNLRGALKKTRADVLTIEAADGSYQKPKIVRARAKVRFEGPTHEVLVGGKREALGGVVFDELLKTKDELLEKFTRDVEILLDYAAECDDPRWWLYLGQSLEGLGKHVRAADAYARSFDRYRVGNEAGWAAYRQADQLYRLGRNEEAVAVAARGLGANPLLAECAWLAAVAAYRLGRKQEAVAWARMAEATGLYNGSGQARAFFRHPPALYELPYDVLRFALPDKEGREKADRDFQSAQFARMGVSNVMELDRLSVSREALAARREEARMLLRPALIKEFCPSARFTPIDFKPPKNRRAMNPSICRHDGQLWCVVRTVNYWVKGRKYGILDKDGITRTENYLGRFRRDGRLTEMRRMRDRDPSYQEPLGYEDVRLASVGGKLVASATVCDKRDTKLRRMAALKFDARGSVARARVQPALQKHEKNWLPFAHGGKLAWIYSIDPTIIMPAGIKRKCPFALEHLRGGAVTEFDGGYLAVTHEVVDEVDGRVYLHRFVQLDRRLAVTAVSPAFVFAHYGIEFAAGICVDGGKIVVSFGVEDKEAWIVRVDVGEVVGMLYKP